MLPKRGLVTCEVSYGWNGGTQNGRSGGVLINSPWSASTARRGSHEAWLIGTVKVTQSCPTLCDPMDYTVHGILQARILVWVAFPFSRGSAQPTDRTQVSCIAGGFFTSWATREAVYDVCDYFHFLIPNFVQLLKKTFKIENTSHFNNMPIMLTKNDMI